MERLKHYNKDSNNFPINNFRVSNSLRHTQKFPTQMQTDKKCFHTKKLKKTFQLKNHIICCLVYAKNMPICRVFEISASHFPLTHSHKGGNFTFCTVAESADIFGHPNKQSYSRKSAN